MSAKTMTAVPPAPTFADCKTATVEFFAHRAGNGDLFALNAGVPADVALEQASAFLEVVIDTIGDCAPSAPDSILWGAMYVAEMAKALVDGVVNGVIDHEV